MTPLETFIELDALTGELNKPVAEAVLIELRNLMLRKLGSVAREVKPIISDQWIEEFGIKLDEFSWHLRDPEQFEQFYLLSKFYEISEADRLATEIVLSCNLAIENWATYRAHREKIEKLLLKLNLERGRKISAANSKKASEKRIRINDEGEFISDIYIKCAKRMKEGLRAKEAWQEVLVPALRERRLDPKEEVDDQGKLIVKYNSLDGRDYRTLTFRSFETLMSRARKSLEKNQQRPG